MISIQVFVVKIKGNREMVNGLSYRGQFSKLSDFIENGLKLIELLCRFKKVLFSIRTMSLYRSMKRSKVNTQRRHKGNDLRPLIILVPDIRCIKLYIFWMHTSVWLIWAKFHQNRMILKIWPLCKRSLTFILFSRYLDNETSYGYHVIDFFTPYD